MKKNKYVNLLLLLVTFLGTQAISNMSVAGLYQPSFSKKNYN